MEPSSEPYKAPITETPFSPPGQEQRYFVGYSVGDVDLTVNWASRHSGGNGLGHLSFTVEYENLRNSRATYDPSDALDVGCIYADNTYFKDKPSIFTQGNFPDTNLTPHSSLHAVGILAFEPYETKVVEINVHGSCTYLGTKNGGYWWAMPPMHD